MSYKSFRKQQKQDKHKEINTSQKARWRLPVGLLVLLILTLLGAGYVFPSAWNATIGQADALSMQERPFRLGLDLLGGSHLV